jgi:hypothetical protein
MATHLLLLLEGEVQETEAEGLNGGKTTLAPCIQLSAVLALVEVTLVCGAETSVTTGVGMCA